MSRILLPLDGHEVTCIYACVTSELQLLEDELESGTVAPEDVAEAQRSIDTCKSVLAKIASACPNSTFSFPE